jgi:hypothetical protein
MESTRYGRYPAGDPDQSNLCTRVSECPSPEYGSQILASVLSVRPALVTRPNPPDFHSQIAIFPSNKSHATRNRDRTIYRFTMVEETKEKTPLHSGTSLRVAAIVLSNLSRALLESHFALMPKNPNR